MEYTQKQLLDCFETLQANGYYTNTQLDFKDILTPNIHQYLVFSNKNRCIGVDFKVNKRSYVHIGFTVSEILSNIRQNTKQVYYQDTPPTTITEALSLFRKHTTKPNGLKDYGNGFKTRVLPHQQTTNHITELFIGLCRLLGNDESFEQNGISIKGADKNLIIRVKNKQFLVERNPKKPNTGYWSVINNRATPITTEEILELLAVTFEDCVVLAQRINLTEQHVYYVGCNYSVMKNNEDLWFIPTDKAHLIAFLVRDGNIMPVTRLNGTKGYLKDYLPDIFVRSKQLPYCESCGGIGNTELHSCPYFEEIYNCDDNCNCCGKCEEQCYMEI